MSFFLKLNFRLDFSLLLNDIKSDKFVWSKHEHNMPTALLSKIYDREIKKIINTEEDTKIVIHNLLPLNSLKKKDVPYLSDWHIDNHRKSAILIQISEDNPNHYAEFRKDNDFHRAPYTQGVPLIFDVKEIHRAKNYDDLKPRNLMAISYQNSSFDDLCNMYESGSLINYDNFENNLFRPVIL